MAAKRTGNPVGRPKGSTGRQRTLRGYRTMADETLHKFRQGLITAAECKSAVAAIQQTASIYLQELVMNSQGIRDEEPVHHLDERGGDEHVRVEFKPTETSKKHRVVDEETGETTETTVSYMDYTPAELKQLEGIKYARVDHVSVETIQPEEDQDG